MSDDRTTTPKIYPDHRIFPALYRRTGMNARAIPTKTAEIALLGNCLLITDD
jgi:hypothetical protein